MIVNPTKIDDPDNFRAQVDSVMADHGWAEPLWLETTVEDPGRGQTRAALQAGIDLVVASGGDGTVTACGAGLAGTGTPLAVLPVGTGNLLARNLDLPMHLSEALVVALTGTDQPLDVGIANGEPFLVMAGLGLDAEMLDSTSETAKKRLGWVAYVFAALAHLRDRPMRVTLQADRGPSLRRSASEVIVGNVGWLQGGLPLMPDARPGDGHLDLVVLTTQGWPSWLLVVADVLGRRGSTSRVIRRTFRELCVEVDSEQRWELDGETMGSTRQLLISISPDKLLLRMPRPE